MSVAFISYMNRASLGKDLGCAEVGKFRLAVIRGIHVQSSWYLIETETNIRDDWRPPSKCVSVEVAANSVCRQCGLR